MWRNYLTVGIRALAKNKTYAFINIFGLAIGMAACLMILLFVRYEMSYDKWLPDSDRVFQVQNWFRDPQTGEEGKLQMAPFVIAGLLALVIAVGTVSGHALRVSRTNPIHALRYE